MVAPCAALNISEPHSYDSNLTISLTCVCVAFQTQPGLEQYAITKFAESLEVVPRALAENSGVKATEVVSKLYAAHQQGQRNAGFDIEVRTGALLGVRWLGVRE
jgi:hypothetical protein